MRKIISLFKRDYGERKRPVYNEVVSGGEWVLKGEGIATIKYDGTCCLVHDGILYKRYDRKMTKKNYKQLKNDPSFKPRIEHYKSAPLDWKAAETHPNHHTGHWPGWLPVKNIPEDRWHREAWENYMKKPHDGTWELVGPRIQANPYDLSEHKFWRHGIKFTKIPPRNFEGLKEYFFQNILEGIVWHHPDGRMVKIKRSDFGYSWPKSLSDK